MQIQNIKIQIKNVEMQLNNLVIQMKNFGPLNIGMQINSIGIQFLNMGIQMINIGMNMPNIQNDMFNFNQNIQNIINQLENIGISNQQMGIPMGMNMPPIKMNNPMLNNDFMGGFDDETMDKFNMNKCKLNAIFKTEDGNKNKITVDYGTTIDDLLKKYLNISDKSPSEVSFLFNGKRIKLGNHTIVENYFLIDNPFILVVKQF